MSQNISTAVMQRRVEPDDSLDDFPTPSFATRAVIEHVIMPLYASAPEIARMALRKMTVAEPCCNRGYMVRPLGEYFRNVVASDIFDYGHGYYKRDYLSDHPAAAAWTFMNPPFRLGQEFIEKSFETPAWQGTAVIVRSAFLEGAVRYTNLFGIRPPSIVAQHVERVIMTKGIVRDPSKEYWDEAAGKMKRPSTATSYCWLIWLASTPWNCTRMMWIPPCRKAMERPGDYPETP